MRSFLATAFLFLRSEADLASALGSPIKALIRPDIYKAPAEPATPPLPASATKLDVAAVADATVLLTILWEAPLRSQRAPFTKAFVDEALPVLYADHFGLYAELSSFSDKPGPFTGVGTYGAYPAYWNQDWCYRTEMTFSPDYTHMQTAIAQVPSAWGLDSWNAQFEAIVHAAIDNDLNLVPDTKRVILLVTKGYGHSPALFDAQMFRDEFNAPVVCEGEGKTSGGFGATEHYDLSGWLAPYDLEHEDLHALYESEYAPLLAKKVCDPESIDADRDARIKELQDIFAAITVPNVEPFDFEKLKTDPDAHCRGNEYPSYAEVTNILNKGNFTLAVLYTGPEKAEARASTDDVIWKWCLDDSSCLGNASTVFKTVFANDIPNLSKTLSDLIAEAKQA